MPRKLTTEEFCIKARMVHGDKYDYTKAVYSGTVNQIEIICPIHGSFFQTPLSHLSGNGCSKCSGRYHRTNEEFIEEAKIVHKNKYDYSRAIFVGMFKKIEIGCPVPGHGFFWQIASNHLHKNRGCSKCSNNCPFTTESFIEAAKKVHENKYDYSRVLFRGMKVKIEIGCLVPGHGFFLTAPDNHLHGLKTGVQRGGGCTKCSNMYRRSTEEFKEDARKIHGDKYDYSRSVFHDMFTKIEIGCRVPGHGFFFQDASSHLHSQQGCPACGLGFTRERILKLIQELSETDLLHMDSIELYTILAQGNLPPVFRRLFDTDPGTEGRAKSLRELQELLENVEDEDGKWKDVLDGTGESGEEIEVKDTIDDPVITSETTPDHPSVPTLPRLNITDDLNQFDISPIFAQCDEETMRFLIQKKIHKFWNEVVENPSMVDAIRVNVGGKYATIVKEQFIKEYDEVVGQSIPDGYSYYIKSPSLMQLLTMHRITKHQNYGNWSGTGAGKTLAFILTSRKIDARLTLVVCFNSTAETIGKEIEKAFPNNTVVKYSHELGTVYDRNTHNYLVLNYEKFQQGDSAEFLYQDLTNNNQIDFMVFDEVQFVKQRREEEESLRREMLKRIAGRIREKNYTAHTFLFSFCFQQFTKNNFILFQVYLYHGTLSEFSGKEFFGK